MRGDETVGDRAQPPGGSALVDVLESAPAGEARPAVQPAPGPSWAATSGGVEAMAQANELPWDDLTFEEDADGAADAAPVAVLAVPGQPRQDAATAVPGQPRQAVGPNSGEAEIPGLGGGDGTGPSQSSGRTRAWRCTGARQGLVGAARPVSCRRRRRKSPPRCSRPVLLRVDVDAGAGVSGGFGRAQDVGHG